MTAKFLEHKTVDKTKNGYMDAFIVTAKIDKKDSVWI